MSGEDSVIPLGKTKEPFSDNPIIILFEISVGFVPNASYVPKLKNPFLVPGVELLIIISSPSGVLRGIYISTSQSSIELNC